jgi:hypothetical protein
VFKVENTGTSAWKRILDRDGKLVANLDELYNGDWSITKTDSLDWITETRFSNATKAVNWLWKNRHNLGEPFCLYEDVRKQLPNKPEPVLEENTNNDLFFTLGKLKK